jgi:hypothetical protein
MNCQRFETAVNDLARDQMMDAATRVRAQAHASDCPRCAARLADERMLTAGLRRLAASTEAEAIPARLESQLLVAFRAQHTATPAPAPIIAPTRRWSRAALAAAAAVILAALAVVAIRFASSPAPSATANAANVERATDWLASRVPVSIPPDRSSPQPVADVHPGAQSVPVIAPHRARRQQKAAPVVDDPDAATEIATDFIPLIQGDNLTLLEEGQMMRVELPRTALLDFGLPMNPERVAERIKADVVIGNDGLARAIRFVR